MSTQAVRRSAADGLLEQAVKRARMMRRGEGSSSPSSVKSIKKEEEEEIEESPLAAYTRSQVESLEGSDNSDSKSDIIKNNLDVTMILQSLNTTKVDLDILTPIIAAAAASSTATPSTPTTAHAPVPSATASSVGPSDVSSFTPETTFALIECVKNLPALWDPTSGSSQRTKKDTWALVSDAMADRGYSVDSRLCCSKFRILRDSYMRIIRKSISKGASASEKGKSWQFFEPLKFLGDGNGGAIPGEDRSSSSPEVADQIIERSYNDILFNTVSLEAAAIEEKERKEAAEKEAAAAVAAAAAAAVAAAAAAAAALPQPSSSKAKESCLSLPPLIPPLILKNPSFSTASSCSSSASSSSSSSSSSASSSSTPKATSSALPAVPLLSKTVTPATAKSAVGGTLRIVDTWSSFGDHVADVLREMSRLEENDAWEMRFSIDKLLIERIEHLRGERTIKKK